MTERVTAEDKSELNKFINGFTFSVHHKRIIENLLADLDDAHKRIAAAEEHAGRVCWENADLKNRLSELEAENARLRRQLSEQSHWMFTETELLARISSLETDLAQAREEIERLKAWMSIETAPKDGEHVLIAVTGGPHGDTIVEAYWHVVEKSWWLGSTSPAMDYADPITEIMYGEISHWRPMPDAPRVLAKPKGGAE